ncbi:hypothetical protein Y023_5702 [Burkholderia pseudomallei A79D]|nr:hypothetical protein DO62_4465 [Burkholderia pseudomallei]KGS20781.1 hypothetical protein X941_5720 [Burkholderia pseudomallei MSHR5569]KGX94668.1 hypothetical protein Y023_5702 [Burkholderia pseudomallei A79D]
MPIDHRAEQTETPLPVQHKGSPIQPIYDFNFPISINIEIRYLSDRQKSAPRNTGPHHLGRMQVQYILSTYEIKTAHTTPLLNLYKSISPDKTRAISFIA